MKMIESGNVAAAIGVKLARAQVVAAYPITPQTPLTEKLSEMIEAGEMAAEYIAVESEHSALGVCIGAASAGARAFTATSANGLLYMSEQIHWAAGARLPLVMCVVNRGVGAPWTVWNDHQDSISLRDAGWIQIYVNDHQEIIDTVIRGFKLAETMSVPVMVCYDGYYLSHTYMPFDAPSQEIVDQFISPYQFKYTLDPERPENLNTVTMPYGRPDAEGIMRPGYMDIRFNLQMELLKAEPVYEEITSTFNKLFNSNENSIITEYKCQSADFIVVSMGSLSNRIKDAVDIINEEGIKVGLVSIHMYRPFPANKLVDILNGKKAVIILEKGLSYGYQGALAGDIKSALYKVDNQPYIHSYIAGLGGREIKNDDLYDNIKDSCLNYQQAKVDSIWIGLNR